MFLKCSGLFDSAECPADQDPFVVPVAFGFFGEGEAEFVADPGED